MIGLFGVVLAIVMSQIWLALARHRQRYRWLPWATATYDISLTTLVLAILATDSPVTGLNSMVAWVFYLIAIGMTALRNDGRLTLYSGALAIAQYALLAVCILTLNSPDQLASIEYGTATASNQIQRLVLLALMTAITATIVYRMQRLVDMSGTDGLTGLPNRTWLLHRFPGLLDAARADGVSLCLALIDLDGFKRINDEIGHHAGDRALLHVVGLLQDTPEDGEWLIRLGGEEFVVLMPDTDLAFARAIAERVRHSMASQPIEAGADQPLNITVSVGVALNEHPDDTPDTILKRADISLYRAKREGRNRVVYEAA